MSRSENHHDLVDGLRQMADFLEAHPETIGERHPGSVVYALFNQDLADVARRGYGRLEKKDFGGIFTLRKHFGRYVCLDFDQPRDQVCTRRKVGEKVHEAKPEETVIIPARDAYVEEVFEWECPPILRKEGQKASEDVDLAEQYGPPDEADTQELATPPAMHDAANVQTSSTE